MSEYKLYIELILEMIEKIEKSLGKTLKDNDTWDAILMRFQVIGENITHLPKSSLNKHKEINWKKFYLFRNDINHAYLDVPETMVASLIEELPSLKKVMIKIRSEIK